ncbi:SpaA isopeptide-forming pilin-related protein [Pauljensenia sp. 20925_1_27]
MHHDEAVSSARLADTAPPRGRYAPEASLRTRGPRPRRFFAHALIAGALAAAAALTALTSAVEPAHAEAPLETPGVTTTSFNRAEGRIGATVINNTEGDRTTFVSDNGYFGVVRGQSRYNSSDPNQSSIKHTSGTQVQPWLKASVAESGDYWSYIVRGRPYTATSEYRDGVINASTTSALGYKPNDPGTVTLGEPFLIGAVRHNNFTILTWNGWVHSTFDVRIGDLEESFPFDQQETDNDTETTAVPRAGGAYEETTSVPNGYGCYPGAPYKARKRGDKSRWYCHRHVGEGKGSVDIYKKSDDPYDRKTYPDSKGEPGQTPYSDDILTIRKTTSEKTVMINGMPHRLFIYGFVPNADGNCPAQPPAGVEPVATFVTKENRSSFGCMYGSFQQERYVRVAKAITEDSEGVGGTIPPFTFTTRAVGDWAGMTGTPDSTLVAADGFVADGSFSESQLTPTGYGADGTATSGYKAFIPGQSKFVIAETGPVLPGFSPKPGYFGPTWETSELSGSPVWAMTDVTCLNGVGERVNVTRDATTGGVDFSQVAPASSPAALPITCTFTNQLQSPNLRLKKELDGVDGATTDDITVTYRITATNDGNVKGSTGRVVDRPDFAPGLTVQSARITTEPENIDQVPALPATENYVLTEGTDIEPGASVTWFIRFTVARDKSAEGYKETLLECRTENERLVPGHGLYNEVAGPKDHDGSANNEACAPARPRLIRIEKAGTQPVGTPNDDGTYPLDGAAFAIYDNAELSGTPVSVLDGGSSFVVSSLEKGVTYWLVETRAPAGHVLLPRPVPFHIEVGTDDACSTVVVADYGPDQGFTSVRVLPADADASGDAALPGIRVVDTQVGTLPKAGSIGVYPQLAVGAALLGLAGCAWRRREWARAS